MTFSRATIFRLTSSGHLKTVLTGLTTVLGVAFEREGYLYILENTTSNNPFATPGTGKPIGMVSSVHAYCSRTVIPGALSGICLNPDTS